MYNNKSLKERQLFDEKLIQASSECSTCALTQDKKKGKAGINRNAKITKYRRSLINNMNAIAEQNFVKTSQRFSDLVKKCQGKRGSFEMKQPTRLLTEEEKADGQSNDMSAATVATLAELADRVATAEGETNADYQTNENEDVQDSYTFVSSSPFRGQHVDANGNIRRKDISTVQPYEMIYIDFYQLPAEQFCARQYALIFVDYKTFNVDVHLCKTKDECGEAITMMLVKRNVHHLPYQCTIYRDGCPSLNHVGVAALKLGVKTEIIAPYKPDLNFAELTIRIIIKMAKRFCLYAKMHPRYLGLALQCAAHHHQHIATTELRQGKTPFESLYGIKSDITKMRPFGSMCMATLSTAKRKDGERNSKGLAVLTTSEPCIMIGYLNFASNRTYKLFTLQGQIIHSSDVYWTVCDPREQTIHDFNPRVFVHDFEKVKFQDFEQMVAIQEDTPHELMSDSELTIRIKMLPEFTKQRKTATEEDLRDILKRYDRPREYFLQQVISAEFEEQAQEMVSGDNINDPAMVPDIGPIKELPSKAGQDTTPTMRAGKTRAQSRNTNLDVTSQQGPATTTTNSQVQTGITYNKLNIMSQAYAKEAIQNTKDMNWKSALQKPEMKEKVLAAYDKEYVSLTDTHGILIPLTDSDPEYMEARRTACPARAILSFKRDNEAKARIVLRGDLQDPATDPSGFNYFSETVSWTSIRTAFAHFISDEEVIGIADVATAFLQAHKFKAGDPKKYVRLRNPITGEVQFFKQMGPLYGERSAPIKWQDTISEWLEANGFVRGKNDTCIYIYRLNGLKILLYVDDMLMIGSRAAVTGAYKKIQSQFQMKDLIIVEDGHTEDYLSMEVTLRKEGLYLSMQEYAAKVVDFMSQDEDKMHVLKYPYNHRMETEYDDTPLSEAKRKKFMSGLGCVGWMATTFRGDLSYAHSMIAQSMAKPTQLAYDKLLDVIRYLKGTITMAAFVPARKKGATLVMEFYCDSDLGHDFSKQNNGRSRFGNIAILSGFPLMYRSSTTTAAMANSKFTEPHVTDNVAESEIYASSNATKDFMYLQYVTEEMGEHFRLPYELQMDNKAAEVFANGTGKSRKLRHIDLRLEWVLEVRRKCIMQPKWIPTRTNVADIFTKGVTSPNFIALRDRFLTNMEVLTR